MIISQYNPFRYRGYYYDIDSGWYYLQTRYYDPWMARFISADGAIYHNLLGCNMFAYCYNNPVNYVDPYGESGSAIIATAGGIALIDGPLPIGDILAVLIIGIGTISLKYISDEKGILSFPITNTLSYKDYFTNSPVDTNMSNDIEYIPIHTPASQSGITSYPIENIDYYIVVSAKGDIKKYGLPTRGKIRYVPPQNGIIGNRKYGFVDRFGNIWTSGSSRTKGEAFEWDVQLSRQGRIQLGWASRDGKHLNVSLKGHITHK